MPTFARAQKTHPGIRFIYLNQGESLAAIERYLNQLGVELDFVVVVLLLYTLNFTISLGVGYWPLPRADAIALVYGTVMRNLSIALALAMNLFGSAGSDAALIIALAFVIQVQAAAWSVKLTTRLFGPPQSEH